MHGWRGIIPGKRKEVQQKLSQVLNSPGGPELRRQRPERGGVEACAHDRTASRQHWCKEIANDTTDVEKRHHIH